MEEYLEFAPFVLFLLLALGGGLLKKYIEKQQAEKDAAQRQTRGTAAKPTRPTPAGRRPDTQPQKPALPQQPIAPPRPGPGPRPTPAAPRRQEPPGVAVARQAIRQRAQRRGAPARAARGRAAPAPAEEQPEEASVGTLDERHLESPGTGMVSALRGRVFHPATERPAAAPSVAARPAAGFLGTMLRGRNAARAIVLSEILGPPRGFQDL